MHILGLTGSIGMGKSTTAGLFAELGVPVHSADEAVHALYSGPDAARVEARFPGVLKDGRIDRTALSKAVLVSPQALQDLEAIVHPLVRQAEDAFLTKAREAGEPLVVLDIPLLFEAGRAEDVDSILVVTAPPQVQEERVLERPGMTAEKLRAILARQMPDSEKRRRADYVIDTASGLDAAREAVTALVAKLGIASRRG